jgi:hypothetical protein
LRDYRGVAATLSLLLVLVVLVAIGFAVYTYEHDSKSMASVSSPSPSVSVSPTSSQTPALHTPVEALTQVENLYNGYIHDLNESTLSSTYGPYFTSQLRSTLFPSTPTSSGDPVLCGAENTPTSLSFGQPAASNGSAKIVVSEYAASSSPSAEFSVTVSLNSLLVTALSCAH